MSSFTQQKLTNTQKKLNMRHRNNELASDAAQEPPVSSFPQQKLTNTQKKLNMRHRNKELASDTAQEPLVGSFPQLFGTEQGRRLQAWCRKQGWVLAWALGSVGADPDPHSHGGSGPDGRGSAPFANRSLDLQVRA